MARALRAGGTGLVGEVFTLAFCFFLSFCGIGLLAVPGVLSVVVDRVLRRLGVTVRSPVRFTKASGLWLLALGLFHRIPLWWLVRERFYAPHLDSRPSFVDPSTLALYLGAAALVGALLGPFFLALGRGVGDHRGGAPTLIAGAFRRAGHAGLVRTVRVGALAGAILVLPDLAVLLASLTLAADLSFVFVFAVFAWPILTAATAIGVAALAVGVGVELDGRNTPRRPDVRPVFLPVVLLVLAFAGSLAAAQVPLPADPHLGADIDAIVERTPRGTPLVPNREEHVWEAEGVAFSTHPWGSVPLGGSGLRVAYRERPQHRPRDVELLVQASDNSRVVARGFPRRGDGHELRHLAVRRVASGFDVYVVSQDRAGRVRLDRAGRRPGDGPVARAVASIGALGIALHAVWILLLAVWLAMLADALHRAAAGRRRQAGDIALRGTFEIPAEARVRMGEAKLRVRGPAWVFGDDGERPLRLPEGSVDAVGAWGPVRSGTPVVVLARLANLGEGHRDAAQPLPAGALLTLGAPEEVVARLRARVVGQAGMEVVLLAVGLAAVVGWTAWSLGA